jgi:8-oxo-dGTP pyrophosphatase MutT (NUDIX family)
MSAAAANADDNPFDPKDPTNPAKAPRPKDAATLILLRTVRGQTEVLMGQRARGHVFMPDKWVFPGGRLDPADSIAPAATELSAATAAKLALFTPARKPRAFALAAVRETFEEAGLIVGRRGAVTQKAPSPWRAFIAQDAAPELHKLDFICRAITPPYRPRRFDARFFMAQAENVLLDDRPIQGDQELLHTRWFTLDEAEGLDLPSVTRFVLGEVRARLRGEALAPSFLRWTRKGHAMERL